MRPRVLILFENLGMGHQRMADILADILHDAMKVDIVSRAGTELLNAASGQAVVDFWNFLLRKHWIAAADYLVNWLARLFELPFEDLFDPPRFFAKLDEIQPNIILCTADLYGKMLAAYAAPRGIPLYIVVTDISVYMDLVNPYATHLCYFEETAAAVRAFDVSYAYFTHRLLPSSHIKHKLLYLCKLWNDHLLHPRTRSMFREAGMSAPPKNACRCITLGPLAERKHFQQPNIDAFKEQLGLNRETDTVLIASGSIGGRFVRDMVNHLCTGAQRPLNLLVMCGKDEATCRTLQSRQLRPDIRVYPQGFVDNFHQFLAVSDCIICRPSASVFIESLVARTPVIAYGRVLSNDRGSLTLMAKHGLGEHVHKKRDLLPALESVLTHKTRYTANIDAFLANYPASYKDMAAIITTEIRHALGIEDTAPLKPWPTCSNPS